MAKIKKRLDQLVQEKMPQYSRTQIQSWIMQGKVLVGGKPVTKAGTVVDEEADLELRAEEPKYVSRAGFKLEKALDHFGIDVHDLVVVGCRYFNWWLYRLLIATRCKKSVWC